MKINGKATSEEQLRAMLRYNYEAYAETVLRIRTKSDGVVPFRFNAAQRYVHQRAEDMKRRKGYVRLVILKGRQQGISTYITGRYYWLVTHSRGLRAFILTHEMMATENLFGMTQRYNTLADPMFALKASSANAKELAFAVLDSSIAVGTAGNKAVGVSQTIQLFHGSEVALWPNPEDHLAGIMQAIPLAPGSEVFLESTSRGLGNLFYDKSMQAMSGVGEFEFVFVPWFWQEEYRIPGTTELKLDKDEAALVELYGLDDEQLQWRRIKIAEMGPRRFKQEYPATPEEAFEVSGPNVLISTSLMRAAVGREVRPIDGGIVWGVDCSLGGDRSTLAKRKTNVLLEPVKTLLEGEASYDTIAVARAVLGEWRKTPPSMRPTAICVDTIGIGAGVAAEMREQHLPTVDVNVSERASANDRFFKLRDELWWRVFEFFDDRRSCIPKDDALIVELAGITFDDNNATGRVKIEGKKDMKKRMGGKSPDLAEAFMLTFASADTPTSQRSYEPPGYEGDVG